MPVLVVREGPSAGHRVEVVGEVVLGRADSEFLQHDTEISRRHVAVRSGARGLEVEDLGSSNGTFVNDARIEGTQPLRSGDVVRVGQTVFVVEIEAAEQPTTVRETVSPPPAEPDMTTQPQPPVAPPGPPATPSAYEPPPSAPPAYGPPPGAPAYGVPGPSPTAARPGGVATAGIVLLIVGVLGLGYNGWDAILLLGDLELASAFGFGGRLMTLLVIDVALLVAAVVQVVAGIRVFSLSRTGRTLGIIASFAVVGLWLISLLLILAWGFVYSGLAWAVLALSVAGSVVAAILLISAARTFPPKH